MDRHPALPYEWGKEIAMRRCYGLLALVAAWAALGTTPAAAQSTSTAAVQELTALLDKAKLDSVAARLPGAEDTFVAALYFPGQQIIVVSGRYAAPRLLREKILLKRHRDAYLDLYGASDIATRQVVEDLRADGLRPLPGKNEPFDVYTSPAAKPMSFDGRWKQQKLSEDAYLDAFRQADTAYATMVGALVAALKGTPEPASVPPTTAQAIR
jgi:hypothetical protein